MPADKAFRIMRRKLRLEEWHFKITFVNLIEVVASQGLKGFSHPIIKTYVLVNTRIDKCPHRAHLKKTS